MCSHVHANSQLRLPSYGVVLGLQATNMSAGAYSYQEATAGGGWPHAQSTVGPLELIRSMWQSAAVGSAMRPEKKGRLTGRGTGTEVCGLLHWQYLAGLAAQFFTPFRSCSQ